MILLYYILWLTLWFALNGVVTADCVLFGACTVLLLDLLTNRTRQRGATHAIHALPRLLSIFGDAIFCAVLSLKNLLLGSLHIIQVLLSREIELEPCLVRLPLNKKNLAERAVLSSLRGIIPVHEDESKNEMTFHALNRESARCLAENINMNIKGSDVQ